MAVLLTRSEEHNARIACTLEGEGIATLSWPLSRIVFTCNELDAPQGTDALVFTSANGVAGFARACPVRDLPAICVGARTAEQAQAAGIARVACAGPDVEALIAHLKAAPYRRLLYARGRDISVDLTSALPQEFDLFQQIVYRAEPGGPPESNVLDAFADGRIIAISVWSRRNAEVLAGHLENFPEIAPPRLNLVAISENAAQPLGKSGFRRIFIAETPDAPGMTTGLSAAVRQESLGR